MMVRMVLASLKQGMTIESFILVKSERMRWRRGQRKLLSVGHGSAAERLHPRGRGIRRVAPGDPRLELRGVEEPRGVRHEGRGAGRDREAGLEVGPQAGVGDPIP